MRRVLTSLSMILAAVFTTAVSAPAAFAMRVVGPSGGAPGSSYATSAHGNAGLAGWEMALIVVGAAIVLFAVATLASYSRRRRVLRPAAI